jgi:hypothetical protein
MERSFNPRLTRLDLLVCGRPLRGDLPPPAWLILANSTTCPSGQQRHCRGVDGTWMPLTRKKIAHIDVKVN